MANLRFLRPSLVLVAFALATSGCLKTRAQLKGESDDDAPARPQKAEIQDVQPQGSYVIDEIKGEMTRLTGRIEDVERQQRQSSKDEGAAAKAEIKKLETRIQELEQAQAAMIEQIKKMQASAPPADPAELFEKGRTQHAAGNHESAIEALSTYLKTPKAKNAEDATFLRAESFYETKQYQKAIGDYSKFPEKYTKSKRMPYVLLKIGQSFDALGMRDDAKAFYQDLVEKFPKSPEAKKARKKVR